MKRLIGLMRRIFYPIYLLLLAIYLKYAALLKFWIKKVKRLRIDAPEM